MDTPERLSNRFQKELNGRILFLQKIVRNTGERIITNHIPLSWDSLSGQIPVPEDMFCTLAIYDGDSLIFWTDNSATLPHRISEKIDSFPALVRLEDGWYLMEVQRRDQAVIAALLRVKTEYPFQNQYLRNSFTPDFSLPGNVRISAEHGEYPISLPGGHWTGSLIFPLKPDKSGHPYLLLSFLLFGYLFLILFLCNRFSIWQKYSGPVPISWIMLTSVIILIRSVQWLSHWPEAIYSTHLYGPGLFAVSAFFPSLGDLHINCFLLMILLFILFFNRKNRVKVKGEPKVENNLIWLTGLILSALFLFGIMAMIRLLVIHSSFPMNLESITSLQLESLIAFLTIGFLLVSWVLVTAMFISSVPIRYISRNLASFPSAGWLFMALVMVSAVGTLILYRSNQEKDHLQRDLIALRLETSRNPITEFRLREIVDEIRKDTLFLRAATEKIFQFSGLKDAEDKAIINKPEQHDQDPFSQMNLYLIQRYFSVDWANYSIQITPCFADQMLQIQPQGFLTDCNGFFQEMIRLSGKEAGADVWFLDYGDGSENYLLNLEAE